MGTDTSSDGGTDGPSDDSVTRLSRAEMAEDVRALVSAVESIHPTPSAGYGSRVELHRTLETTVRELPESATTEEFYRCSASLVAGLDDAHSQLIPPDRDDSNDDRRLPLSFRVVGTELYVESVSDESLRNLLGSRVVDVDGVSIENLTDRVAGLRGVENRYNALWFLGRWVEKYAQLGRLLGESEPPAEVALRGVLDGEEHRRSLTPVRTDADPSYELEATIDQPTGSGSRFRLYEGGEAAVFVPGDLQGYRESYEVAMANDADFATELAPEAHERMVGGDPPDDLNELVAELPSMVETLCDLVREMATAGTRTLFVDLRDNTGGDSQFVNHLAYVLYGWDGVGRATESVRAVKRRTDEHRERYGNWSDESDDGFSTTDENPADYDFGPYFRNVEASREEVIAWTRDRLTSSETFAAEVAEGTHEAYYRPEQIVVVTTAGTLSSAFAGAAQLSTLGADVVGVSSGQAPKSYGEAVSETLPNTGLTAKIAGAMYHWVPEPDGDVLAVDRELTPDLFEQYGRASDAALRLAFDYAGVTERGECPTPR
jgi:hypothetical protein